MLPFVHSDSAFWLTQNDAERPGIQLVLLGLVVMPTTELVLPFNVDRHFITPTTPTQDPPMLPPSSSRRKQQPQRQVPWMLTPEVPMPLPSSGAGHQD